MNTTTRKHPYRVTARPSGLPITVHATNAAAARRQYRRRFPVFTAGQTTHAEEVLR